MYLHSLATAVPPRAFTQLQSWDLAQHPAVRGRLSRRSMLVLHSILRGDHGIATRHFALADPESLFTLSADELNLAFKREAPALAGRALQKALTQAGLRADQLDALLVCTCTGYLCPGVTSYVSEALGLRPNAFLQDLVGLGCGAAIPMLRAARHIVASQPGAIVACVAVEICSAAFYLDDDLGVLMSACIFGDGAAATIWRDVPGPTGLRAFDFATHHEPAHRDKLRFEQRDGKLRNLLDRAVPDLAAQAVRKLWEQRGSRRVSQVIAHTGGRDVLDALAPVVAPHALDASTATLRAYGNMSSPSVLFALERALASATSDSAADGDLWLVSFGAGFSAHSCRLGRDA